MTESNLIDRLAVKLGHAFPVSLIENKRDRERLTVFPRRYKIENELFTDVHDRALI